MSRDRIREARVSRGPLALLEPEAHDPAMPDLHRLVATVAEVLRGPKLTPEEHLRRHAERRDAEAAMRRGIERASRMFGRTNRFVR